MPERLEELKQQLREEKGITTPSNSEVSGIVKSSIDELKNFIKAEIAGLKFEMREIIRSEISGLGERNKQLENEVATLKAQVEKLQKDKQSLIQAIQSVKKSTVQVPATQPSNQPSKVKPYTYEDFKDFSNQVSRPSPSNNQRIVNENLVTSHKILKNTTKSPAVAQYNKLITLSSNKLRQERDNFWNKFDVKFFSCSNSSARMNDPDIEPIFNDVSNRNGDYWALSSSGSFEVFPRLGVYNDNLHNERAMGIVFDSNFKSGKVYEKIHVEFPAKFRRSGTNWILESKGTLFLE